MKILLLCLLSLVIGCSSREMKPKVTNACMAAREFITTMEFLRDQKDFALNEKQSIELADKVSTGCTGASKRFIQVTNLLVKAGFPSQQAILTGTKYAILGEDSAKAFLTIFKSSYLESLLDLNLEQSLAIATELSESTKGHTKHAEKEFTKLVGFCVSKKSLDMPLMDCASTASRVVKSGQEYDFEVGSDFIEVFKFLSDPDKSNLPTYEALIVAESVVKYGPEAKKRLIDAYEYGVSNKGLDKSIKEAIEFGKTMATRSVKLD